MKKTILLIGGLLFTFAIIFVLEKHPVSSLQQRTVATQQPNVIFIKNYMFSPMHVKIKQGTRITWINKDIAKHTITTNDGTTINGPLFGKNQKFSYTFIKSGIYFYHCDPHPYMKAIIEVTK